ncbi:MAG: TetR/AcrR family transcriptional regulator [Candidatus Obscuribacterales bacterium]|nr:TetR/AcrR family transcriptional regulator [Candidatus Obscuribacterales bacterium]
MIITKESSSKEKLIVATIQLMSTRGFEAMGINSILEAADVSKSNFYYHFKSKEELCLAALEAMSNHFFSVFIDPILLDTKLSPKKRLQTLIASFKQKMIDSECCGGCPFVNLAAETADFHPGFRDRIARHYADYAERLARCFEAGIAKGEFTDKVKPAQAAQMMLSLMNGTMLMAKLQKDLSIIDANSQTLFNLLAKRD